MNLVNQYDPILKNKSENFDFNNPQFDPIEFSKTLVKFMYDKNGISLSAPQVGEPYRVFAMRGSPENFVCFNPRIIDTSEELISLEESSLTYPGLIVKIKRPRHIKVRFALPNSEVRTDTFTGMTARVFQHNIDFLDGLVYYNKANKFHRGSAFRKMK